MKSFHSCQNLESICLFFSNKLWVIQCPFSWKQVPVQILCNFHHKRQHKIQFIWFCYCLLYSGKIMTGNKNLVQSFLEQCIVKRGVMSRLSLRFVKHCSWKKYFWLFICLWTVHFLMADKIFTLKKSTKRHHFLIADNIFTAAAGTV